MSILIIKDILEILFFASIIYFFCLWLKKDTRHNLLLYFYTYCILFIFTYLGNFYTIHSFLFYASPIILILFIIFHQDVLQRNFITMTNKANTSPDNESDWIEALIRACLHGMNNHKQVICVIEHTADIGSFLQTPFIFKSPIAHSMLTLLIESNSFNQDQMVWCTTQGKLVGINCSWTFPDTVREKSTKQSDQWKHDALLMTLKTDTIIFKADPAKRAFDIVIKGTLYDTIGAAQTLPFIKKYLSSTISGEKKYDNHREKPLYSSSHPQN